MQQIMRNRVLELAFTSQTAYERMPGDESGIAKFGVSLKKPDGATLYIPGFWAGKNCWKVRLACCETGLYSYSTECEGACGDELAGRTGSFTCVEYTGDNALYRHGRIRVADDRRHFAHQDKTPFFWLGDTWWLGVSKRISLDEFKELTADRKSKGFSLVQIIAGLYPDMEPFDPRGANEAGFPWDEAYESINAAYFDWMDKRIEHLVDSGIVPCMVGFWGYFLEFAGEAVLRKHWEYLICRYSAYPVVWCAAGEPLMPFYGSYKWSGEENELYQALINDKRRLREYQDEKRAAMTRLCLYIKGTDPFGNLLTSHANGQSISSEMVYENIFDFEMMQNGINDETALVTMDLLDKHVKAVDKPLVEGECCYEGSAGECGASIQRFLFWTHFLKGAAGYTYGAMGVWQLNRKDDMFGPSPTGRTWGGKPWNEAYGLPGSKQLGLGKKLLEQFQWWRIAYHPEWTDPCESEGQRKNPYAAGIPGELRLVYITVHSWESPVIKDLEQDVAYNAYYFDPASGEHYDIGEARGDENGEWRPWCSYTFPGYVMPIYQDLVLVMVRK